MHPGASVSGLYFSHPEAKYFGVGQIGRDQVIDYASRRGETIAAVEKRLAPNFRLRSLNRVLCLGARQEQSGVFL